ADFVTSAGLDPTGRFAVAGEERGRTLLWNLRAARVVGVVRGHGWVNDAAFSPDGKLVLIADEEGASLTPFGPCAHAHRCRSVRLATAAAPTGAAFSLDGHYVATFAFEGSTIRVWDAQRCLTHATGCRVASVVLRDYSQLEAVAFGRGLLGAGDNEGRVHVWRLSSGDKPIPRMMKLLRTGAESIGGVAFDPTGRLVAAVGDRRAYVWRCSAAQLASGCKRVLETPDTDWLHAIAISPDGGEFATA